jgi:hypothetical protein
MAENYIDSTIPHIEVLQAHHSALMEQWKLSSADAVKPSMESPVFNRLPDSHYIDVPKAKMQALETAQAFAITSKALSEHHSILPTPELYQTLNDMADFCAGQLKEAQKYSDLKWPESLISPRGEDIKYQQRRRDLAKEAMNHICDAYGALNNG